MCLLCVEFQKERMTLKEAYRALFEMEEAMPPEHRLVIRKMLQEAEERQKQASGSLDPSSLPPSASLKRS